MNGGFVMTRLFLFKCLAPVAYWRAIQAHDPSRIRAASSREAVRDFLAGLPERCELEITGPAVMGFSSITGRVCKSYVLTVWELIE